MSTSGIVLEKVPNTIGVIGWRQISAVQKKLLEKWDNVAATPLTMYLLREISMQISGPDDSFEMTGEARNRQIVSGFWSVLKDCVGTVPVFTTIRTITN